MSATATNGPVSALKIRSRFEDPAQESFVTVTTDGASDFWDGAELKKRIQFAMIGLKLSSD
jgi:hypothetical protein